MFLVQTILSSHFPKPTLPLLNALLEDPALWLHCLLHWNMGVLQQPNFFFNFYINFILIIYDAPVMVPEEKHK